MSEHSVVRVPTAAGDMPAHRWIPDAGSGPGLVLLQEIFGVSPFIRSRAADLAELGYVALAPEIYWRLEDSDVDESLPDALPRALSIRMRVDWDAAVSDSQAALAFLRVHRRCAAAPE